MAEQPLAKRLKPNDNGPQISLLQEVNNLIVRLTAQINNPQNDQPNDRYLAKVQQTLIGLLSSQETVQSSSAPTSSISNAINLTEIVFNATKMIWLQYLSPISLVYIAATSSAIFKIMVPVLRELTFKYPSEGMNWPKATKAFLHPPMTSYAARILFSTKFNAPIRDLPPTATHLTFGSDFNQQVDGLLPPSLTYISFGFVFEQRLHNFPPQLTHLLFSAGPDMNSEIDHFPASLTHLVLGDFVSNFNLDCLPVSLVELEFVSDMSHPIDHLKNLKVLKIGNNCHCPIDSLPDSIHTLVFGRDIYGHVTKLPASLKNLNITFHNGNHGVLDALKVISCPLEKLYITEDHLNPQQEDWWDGCFDALPKTLISLSITCNNFQSRLDHLPTLLEELHIASSLFDEALDHLPPSLKRLTIIAENYNQRLNKVPNITELKLAAVTIEEGNIGSLPSSIQKLVLCMDVVQAIAYPCNLSILKVGLINHPVNNLPPSLVELELASPFNQPVDNLPPLLTRICFGDSFNQPVDNLPSQVVYISFGRDFDQKVDRLPPSLTYLSFGSSFNHKVNMLPSSLLHLKFGRAFRKSTRFFPSSITHLTMEIPTPFNSYKIRKVFFPTNLQEFTFLFGTHTLDFVLWQHKLVWSPPALP